MHIEKVTLNVTNNAKCNQRNANMKYSKKQQQLKQQAKVVHDQLDQMIDGAKSKLADMEVALEHDVKRLSVKFNDSEIGGGEKCVDVRAELSRCYNTLDSEECQVFAKKLEKCVTEALA